MENVVTYAVCYPALFWIGLASVWIFGAALIYTVKFFKD